MRPSPASVKQYRAAQEALKARTIEANRAQLVILAKFLSGKPTSASESLQLDGIRAQISNHLKG